MKYCTILRTYEKEVFNKKELLNYTNRGKRNRRLNYICELLKLKFYK